MPAMKTLKTDWRVVLVRPRNPLNIGAAARAMANFGIRDLVVVSPYEPTWQEFRSAVGAVEVVKLARAVPSLIEAIGDATLVIGTTAGRRRNLDRGLIPLPELAAWLKKHESHSRASILFGSEKTGLSNEALSYCHGLVQIPTVADCPSMNLGQAVAVCAYELERAGVLPSNPPRWTVHRSDPARLQSLEHLYERITRVLDEVAFLRPRSRKAMLIKIRRLLLDLGLTNNDARILGAVLAQVEWKLSQKRKEEVSKQNSKVES
jgi:TrmH family RNA methyltransferase